MGFRFRKQIKIAPGVKLNINKESASISVGGNGFTHTVSTTGKETTTVGLPGSGLSYTTTSGSKKDIKQTTDTDNSKIHDIDPLPDGREFPSDWFYENKNLIEPAKMIHSYLIEKYFEERKNGVLSKYAALKSLVLYIQDLQGSCEAKGEWFVKWFSLFICDAYSMDNYMVSLKDMEENMEDLLHKEKIIEQLKDDLLKIIKEEPGVIQSELYKRFDPELKSDISNELYLLSTNGTITREKSGRSYKLYIK